MILVTQLHDTASKRKDEQGHEKKEAGDFESIFKQACSDVQQKDREINYRTQGYTKNGLAYNYFEKRREYI